jgi:hypothetical protein
MGIHTSANSGNRLTLQQVEEELMDFSPTLELT